MSNQCFCAAQVDYPAACNAVEKVLVHKAWVEKGGLTHLRDAFTKAGVEVHAGVGCGDQDVHAHTSIYNIHKVA